MVTSAKLPQEGTISRRSSREPHKPPLATDSIPVAVSTFGKLSTLPGVVLESWVRTLDRPNSGGNAASVTAASPRPGSGGGR